MLKGVKGLKLGLHVLINLRSYNAREYAKVFLVTCSSLQNISDAFKYIAFAA